MSPGRVIVPKVLEFTLYPFAKGALTNGVSQYSQIYNANLSNTYVSTNGGAFNIIDPEYPGGRGTLREIELSLQAEFQANAATLCTFKWQGRNLAPVETTWVDIVPDTLAQVNTVWRGDMAYMTGIFSPQNGFNSVPFEVRMQYRTNHASLGIGRISGSSWMRALYQIN